MDALEKTMALGRQFIETELLEENPNNPNEMDDAEFNLLYDNIERLGITDPIMVRPLETGKYRIVGGKHRWTVAKLMGMPKVPCTIITDPEFDDDQEEFQLVRMNVIRGHMTPEKFLKLYERQAEKYGKEIMAESFGFAHEEEFKKLIGEVKKQLPKELQKDFAKAAAELKTIDDLSKLLNSLFTRFGETLPYGYMCFDFGGKDSIWLRMNSKTREAVLAIGQACVKHKRTVDDLIGGLLRMAAQGKLDTQLLQLIAESDEVEIPEGVDLPTAETLAGQSTVQ